MFWFSLHHRQAVCSWISRTRLSKVSLHSPVTYLYRSFLLLHQKVGFICFLPQGRFSVPVHLGLVLYGKRIQAWCVSQKKLPPFPRTALQGSFQPCPSLSHKHPVKSVKWMQAPLLGLLTGMLQSHTSLHVAFSNLLKFFSIQFFMKRDHSLYHVFFIIHIS